MRIIIMSKNNAYWSANVSLMIKLLVVWFVVSFGCGILLVDVLNNIQIGGYKLGFWFAQQGAIYTFVVLIFVYAKKMAALDIEHGVDE
ncbi:membrane protein [Marinomonas sp. SBI22]|nr:membrane protein [Marinomonas sp. S3726]KZM42044.1 membrane protein [Marinomonas sp. SBI22]KZM47113.1 membrane protein [Marinomonas sp. SBI8L]